MQSFCHILTTNIHLNPIKAAVENLALMRTELPFLQSIVPPNLSTSTTHRLLNVAHYRSSASAALISLFYISVPYCTSLNKYSNMRSAKDCSQYHSYTLVTYEPSLTLIKQPQWKMGLLPDTQNGILRMRRECRERFPRHRGLAIPTCITARTCRGSCRDR